jgi:hypothetical protein
MNGDDITRRNESMPWFPEGMPFWQRVTCLFGYHKRETRKTGPSHKFPGMKLRDQCGRCHTLLD